MEFVYGTYSYIWQASKVAQKKEERKENTRSYLSKWTIRHASSIVAWAALLEEKNVRVQNCEVEGINKSTFDLFLNIKSTFMQKFKFTIQEMSLTK